MTAEEASFETRAIHAGQAPDPATGAVNVPVYFTSTYAQSEVGVFPFADYARVDNPTRHALEVCLADLEGGAYAVTFASGLAAEDALLRTLAPGDHVIVANDVYGGTYRLLTRVFGPWGLECTPANLTRTDAIEAAWRDETKLVWIETPSNPLLTIVDIAAVAEVAHARGARVVVDNTFATPYLQTPLAHGADVVVHSTTKYIGGHSDVIGGALVTNDEQLAEQLRFVHYAVGGVPGPMDAYLTLRGVKTLAVRMDRHCENAAAVAEMLASHPAVASVRYPGLASHPGHDIATRQMRGFGGMVSFEMRGGKDAATRLVASTEVFTLAESLGGVESLIEHPGAMTHASVAGSELEVPGGLVRLSVGIEGVADLIDDLTRALDQVSQA